MSCVYSWTPYPYYGALYSPWTSSFPINGGCHRAYVKGFDEGRCNHLNPVFGNPYSQENWMFKNGYEKGRAEYRLTKLLEGKQREI